VYIRLYYLSLLFGKEGYTSEENVFRYRFSRANSVCLAPVFVDGQFHEKS
jgi:hypothetical protein